MSFGDVCFRFKSGWCRGRRDGGDEEKKKVGYGEEAGEYMKNYSAWEPYSGFPEGSGRSEKIWLINPKTRETGLFKYKKDVETTDDVSECIAYQLSNLLDIPCAKFELGIYQGRKGSMSYNIVNSSREILIEGINFINVRYPHYDADLFFDKESQDVYSVEMADNILKDVINFKYFLNMLMFDFLIGNSDRHQSNWAIICNDKKEIRFSPLYDNGSSLCAYIKEEQIDSYLGKDKKRWGALVDTKSRSLIRCGKRDKKRPTHLDMIKYLYETYFDETEEFAQKIVESLTKDSIYDALNQYSEDELTRKKKELIFRFLQAKVELLQKVYFGRE